MYFYGSSLGFPGKGLFWTLGLRYILNFKHLSIVVLKVFEYFLYTFLWFEPMMPRYRAILDILNKLGKGPLGMQCYIPNFKHLSKAVLKKKIF